MGNQSKVVRLSGITLDVIETYKNVVINRMPDDLARRCMENMSLDDFIRHVFEVDIMASK